MASRWRGLHATAESIIEWCKIYWPLIFSVDIVPTSTTRRDDDSRSNNIPWYVISIAGRTLGDLEGAKHIFQDVTVALWGKTLPQQERDPLSIPDPICTRPDCKQFPQTENASPIIPAEQQNVVQLTISFWQVVVGANSLAGWQEGKLSRQSGRRKTFVLTFLFDLNTAHLKTLEAPSLAM